MRDQKRKEMALMEAAYMNVGHDGTRASRFRGVGSFKDN